ncbi:GyrI-like domain-containing protein [Saccharibacillus sp. CPCC 101409]|uniref:GyrI-like domain-containing protein n=1 Tax=Saccharibacillus sp. CPCC 101409 TaxID=3058041 RepID=UPI0026729E87|nr:GyrI-like domain-containing protein [Saccharibacillus sp. CPCC 101409]MDO3410563.1 GyrI-like domain-containing protein [Saccharibacillus sp. CPCC 101409]
MERQVDYKKDFKALYQPKEQPEIVDVPAIPFLMLDGEGDPNRDEFVLEMQALYSLSYAVKMSVKSESVPDGPSCQMMHTGSFDDEPASFARMEDFCRETGWIRSSPTHCEIYLSDPRKTEPARLKTVLRFPVEKR